MHVNTFMGGSNGARCDDAPHAPAVALRLPPLDFKKEVTRLPFSYPYPSLPLVANKSRSAHVIRMLQIDLREC